MPRFRWQTCAEWQAQSTGSAVAVGLYLGAFAAVAGLLVVVRQAWWAWLVVPAFIVGDYVLCSAVATLREGGVSSGRSRFQVLTFGAWLDRMRDRHPIYVVAAAFGVALALEIGPTAALLVPLAAAGDYLWCCASPSPRPAPVSLPSSRVRRRPAVGREG